MHRDEQWVGQHFSDWRNVSDQEYNVAYLDTAGNPVNLNNLSEMVYTAVVTDQVGCSHLGDL